MVHDTVSGRRRSVPLPEGPAETAPAVVETRVRKPDGRTRAILAIAGAAALLVNVGAAWSYWRITSAQPAARAATASVELTLRAHSDYNRALLPGQAGNLTITLANDQDFPLSVTRVVREDPSAYADDPHRENGCDPTGVALTRDVFDVDWSVPKNTIGAFTIPDGLRMAVDSPAACRDATFILAIRVIGVSQTQSAG
jgi:hypothetical protein